MVQKSITSLNDFLTLVNMQIYLFVATVLHAYFKAGMFGFVMSVKES